MDDLVSFFLFQAHKLITDWGLDIAKQTVPLAARVLPPETLFFGRGKREQIGIRGDWNRDKYFQFF